MTSLYIHIPFCDQICFYCDFPKRLANSNMKKDYIDALLWEIKQYPLSSLQTVYIGGGTPSSLALSELDRLLSAIETPESEFTFEANPKDISNELLDLLQKHGVTRISLGVQTTNDSLLKSINRDHNYEDIQTAIKRIRTYNFLLNVDLIYGLPMQTKDDVLKDIGEMQSVDHISYYSLILEPKTVFHHRVSNGELELPDMDIDDTWIAESLNQYGFKRYEISNYTKEFPSEHNLVYWNNQEYYAVGAGASGYVDGVRYHNTRNIEEYIKQIFQQQLPIISKDILSKSDQMFEFIMLGFRKLSGVSKSDFLNRYDCEILDVFPNLLKLIEDGFCEMIDDTIKPTKKGLVFNNELLVRLM